MSDGLFVELAVLVQEWNENRIELFHLSYPSETLEIDGVMRFYLQDMPDRVLSKSIRVSSTATAETVVRALSGGFLQDHKIEDGVFSLWEVHQNGVERRLDDEERPMLVQLYWHKEDREGRFVLKRNKLTPASPLMSQCSFTRTLTNPEAVMKRKREQKLNDKLKELENIRDVSGILKIYGGDLVPTRPYVTLLVTESDTAEMILAQALQKYGLDTAYSGYELVEVTEENGMPINILEASAFAPEECPLELLSVKDGNSYLAIRKTETNFNTCPAFVIVQPGGLTTNSVPFLVISPGVTEIGSDKTLEDYTHQTQNIYIADSTVLRRHCSVTFVDGMVTITPKSPNAVVYINKDRIRDTEVLKYGDVVIIGENVAFIFITDCEQS